MKTTLSILAIALAALSTQASAQFYLGGSVGQANHDMNRTDWTHNVAGSSSSFKETATGYKLFGGYKFNQTWGIEGGYTDLRDYRATITPAVAANAGNVTVKTDSWNLFGTGTLPLSNNFSLTGKLGVSRNASKMSFSSNGVNFNRSDAGSSNKTSLAYGIGAGYAFNKNISVRVEYEELGKAGDTNSGFTVAGRTSDSKPSLWSVGVQYTF